MPEMTVTFHGLCGLAMRSNTQYDCLLHPEGGAHKPVLVTRVGNVIISHGNAWDPVYVGHDADGLEIGVWDLAGARLTMGALSADTTVEGRNSAVDLRLFHPGASTKPAAQTDAVLFPGGGRQGALVQLLSGTIQFPMAPSARLSLLKNGNPFYDGTFATSIEWAGERTSLSNGADTLMFRKDVADMSIAITNVATVAFPQGLEHFKYYYDFIDLAPGDYPITLALKPADADVYDCVPPPPLP